MPQVPPQLEPLHIWNLTQFFQMLQKLWQQMSRIVNGQLSFGNGTTIDNISGNWLNFTTTGPNIDMLLTHNLGRVPVGYFIVQKSTNCDLYNGTALGSPQNLTQINLRANANAVVLRVFIF
jgi:hypothetical protein